MLLPPHTPAFLSSAVIESSFPLVVNLLGALVTLVVGWLVAGILAKLVRVLLRRTSLDETLSRMLLGPSSSQNFRIDRLLGTVVFWVVLLLSVVAALNVLNLNTVSEPLNQFLNQIFAFLPKVAGAAVIASIAWVVASLARKALIASTEQLSLDEKLFGKGKPDAPAGVVVGETLANVAYWLILLFFLPLILNTLNLGSQLTPLLNLLDSLLGALPRIVKAAAIAVAGWFIAKIVRLITANLLLSAGIDAIGKNVGLDSSRGSQPISSLAGTVVYILILIPTATASLEALAIPAISGPATLMLQQVITALPRIFTAIVIVGAGVLFGGFIGELVAKLLAGFGLDRVATSLGVSKVASSRSPAASTAEIKPVGETETSEPRRPSEILGTITQVGIALFATFAATSVLGLPELTAVVRGLLLLFGRVVSGVAVFAVGLYLANLSRQLILGSGGQHAGLLAQAARIAILLFSGAMALQQIGLAPNIVMLAFGLILGSLAVAIALAFGLGGQQVAADQLREWRQQIRRE